MPKTLTYNTIERPESKELKPIEITQEIIDNLNNHSKKLNNNGYSYGGADMENYISLIDLSFEDSSGNPINRNFKELSEDEIKIMLNKKDFRDRIIGLIYQCNRDCMEFEKNGKSGLYISKDAANFMKKISEQISNINITDNPNDTILNIDQISVLNIDQISLCDIPNDTILDMDQISLCDIPNDTILDMDPRSDIYVYNDKPSIIKSFCEHYSKAENIITQTVQKEFSKNFNDWEKEKPKDKDNKILRLTKNLYIP
jgi:hypothetical protein